MGYQTNVELHDPRENPHRHHRVIPSPTATRQTSRFQRIHLSIPFSIAYTIPRPNRHTNTMNSIPSHPNALLCIPMLPSSSQSSSPPVHLSSSLSPQVRKLVGPIPSLPFRTPTPPSPPLPVSIAPLAPIPVPSISTIPIPIVASPLWTSSALLSASERVLLRHIHHRGWRQWVSRARTWRRRQS